MSYRIMTDSTADLPQEFLNERGIAYVGLAFQIGGEEYREGPDLKMTSKEFYDQLRAGTPASTVQVNTYEFIDFAEPFLAAGEDVLHIAFSSGLSGTYESCARGAEELRAKYPDRKIVVVDSLAASMGEGLLVYHAAQLQKQGAAIEEVAKWVEENRNRMAHWFTVDDLNHLKRGGRVSGAAALFGTMLGIKPVLHVDDEGHLIPMEKVRGRRQSLDALVKHMAATVENPQDQVVFISHGDCLEDAGYVAQQVREKFQVQDIVINYIGPVIGSHSGPGTVALFFLGKSKN